MWKNSHLRHTRVKIQSAETTSEEIQQRFASYQLYCNNKITGTTKMFIGAVIVGQPLQELTLFT